MRLSMDEVRKQYNGIKKLYAQGLAVAPVDVKQVLDLYDTIEALQADNEQLQARAAQYRDALIMAMEAIKAAWSDIGVNAALDKASEALTKISKALEEASL